MSALPPVAGGRTGWPWTAARVAWPSTAPGGRPWPRISVAVPSLDQGRFLEATLHSLLAQGYPDLEILVADGGSRDHSVAILERYAPHLTWWASEPDGGQAHAVNKGLARASGEILGWLNADDILLPRSLERIARAFVTRPRVAVVAGLRLMLDEQGAVCGRWLRDLPTAAHLRRYCCLAQETVYWRRSVWQRLGPLDEDRAFALDYEYWLRMVEAGIAITLLPAYLGGCRDHPATKRATRTAARERDLAAIFARYRLGASEEQALMAYGPEWAARQALLEDLCMTPWSRHGRLALALLHLLERPAVARRAVSLYRRYRARRPRQGARAGRLGAAGAALAGELLARPQPDRRDPYLLPSGPVQRPRVTCRQAAAGADPSPPVDWLSIGAGWWWLEASRDHVYRWAESFAELVVARPSGLRTGVRLALESGPALAWGAFQLIVRDERERVVARRRLLPRSTVELTLPLFAGARQRCFRLQVTGRAPGRRAADGRLLRFRATACHWLDEAGCRDLPLDDGRVLQLLAAEDDVVAPVPWPAVRGRRVLRALPRDGLFLGPGWHPARRLEGGAVTRRAVCGAQLIVTRGSGRRRQLLVEPAPEAPAGVLRLEADHGPGAEATVPAGGPAVIALRVPRGRSERFRFTFSGERAGDDALTVRRIAWR